MTAWQDRRVFVTGHTGFKGGWLTLWLYEAGAQVFGYALPPESEPNLFAAAGIDRVAQGTMGDIRNLDTLSAALSGCEAEMVFHLAAQPLVRRGYEDPIGTYATNVMGTVHVLEAARRAPSVRAVVAVTSDKCYENREQARAYREEDRLGGKDPYSSSKACAELVAHAWRCSFADLNGKRLMIATVRAGNVVGGGDWAEGRLIPDAARAFAAGKPLRLRRPDAVRPWQHVLEPTGGYIALAERLLNGEQEFCDAFNFGPDPAAGRSVRQVAEDLAALWGDGARCGIDSVSHPPEAERLAIDSAKAEAMLGWRPRLDLKDALQMATDWYKAHGEGMDMERVTRGQIRRYRDCYVGGSAS